MFNDSTRRTIRSGIQQLVGLMTVVATVAAFVAAQPEGTQVFGLDPSQFAGAGATIAVVTLFLTKLQNVLENNGTIPTILKPVDVVEVPVESLPQYPVDSDLQTIQLDMFNSQKLVTGKPDYAPGGVVRSGEKDGL